MGCEIENLSFMDKIKLISVNIEKLSFSSEYWDKNLTINDNTLQKVLDIVNNFSQYENVNNLISTDATATLSAKQGKILKDLVDIKLEDVIGGTLCTIDKTNPKKPIINVTESEGDFFPTDLIPGLNTEDTLEVQSSTGQNIILAKASPFLAGIMGAKDKKALSDLSGKTIEHVSSLTALVTKQGIKKDDKGINYNARVEVEGNIFQFTSLSSLPLHSEYVINGIEGQWLAVFKADETITANSIQDMINLPGSARVCSVMVTDTQGDNRIFKYVLGMVENEVTSFGGWHCEATSRINLIWAGATGDGVTDDYQAFYNAMKVSIDKLLYVPKAKESYLIKQTIDIDTLPAGYISVIGEDIKQQVTGVARGVVLKGGVGLVELFKQKFSPTLANQRQVVFKNLLITSVDLNDAYVLRAPLQAFNIFNSPNSTFENIRGFGIDSLIHVRTAWFSVFKNIRIDRCKKGLFIDGDDGDGGYGWADHTTSENIIVGQANEYGMWLRGSKASTIKMIDGETGLAGTALKIEACKGLTVDGVYFEGYSNARPVVIKGLDGSSLDSMSDFSQNIEIKNLHGLSNIAGTILILPGAIDVSISFGREFRSNTGNNINETGKLVSVSGVGTTIGDYLKINHINISSSSASDNINTQMNTAPYCNAFMLDNKIFQKGTNRGYYGLQLNKGDHYLNLDLNTNQVVTKSGTMLGLQYSAQATTVAGSRKVTVDNTTNLFVNSYITVGTIETRVTKIDRVNKILWLTNSIPAAGVVDVSYTAPEFI